MIFLIPTHLSTQAVEKFFLYFVIIKIIINEILIITYFVLTKVASSFQTSVISTTINIAPKDLIVVQLLIFPSN
jgi:hypothetical protein